MHFMFLPYDENETRYTYTKRLPTFVAIICYNSLKRNDDRKKDVPNFLDYISQKQSQFLFFSIQYLIFSNFNFITLGKCLFLFP